MDESWEDYLYWQKTDKKKLKRINDLIKDITRHPFEGIVNPEPLKYMYKYRHFLLVTVYKCMHQRNLHLFKKQRN